MLPSESIRRGVKAFLTEVLGKYKKGETPFTAEKTSDFGSGKKVLMVL